MSPLRCGTSTGVVSVANCPLVEAAWASWWLRAAHTSCSSRPMPSLSFFWSEDSPMVHWSNAQNSPSCCMTSTISTSPIRAPQRSSLTT
jgi:hypothetical protein